MQCFKDNHDRTWTIAIHVTAVKRCRALIDVDLYGLVEDGFEKLGKLLSDPVKLVDTLYVLCKDEADRLGVSDEDFGRAMYGDAVQRATDAFLKELTDFFPDPRIRAGIGKVLEKSRKVTDLMMDHMSRQLDTIDVESVARNLIDLSKNSPESSGSTPDLAPFENSLSAPKHGPGPRGRTRRRSSA